MLSVIVYLIDVASDDIESKAINNYRDAMTDPSDNFTVPSVAIAMGFPMDSKILMSLHIKQKGLSVF